TTSARIEDERTKFAALRAALGPDVELAIDSHAVQVREPWSRRNALDLARAVEEFDLLFYEEPLRYDAPAGYAELRRHTRVPLAPPVALVDGMVDAPREPGLGVRLEEATIAAYPFRPGNIEFA